MRRNNARVTPMDTPDSVQQAELPRDASLQASPLASPLAHPLANPLANAELVQLQTRVIALENLLIALLAQVPDAQLDVARAMATYISPRRGFTPHPLTVHAAAQMVHLVARSEHFRALEPGPS